MKNSARNHGNACPSSQTPKSRPNNPTSGHWPRLLGGNPHVCLCSATQFLFYEGITFYLLVLTRAAGHGVWASVDSYDSGLCPRYSQGTSPLALATARPRLKTTFTMVGLQLFIFSLVSCLGHALTLSQPRVTNTTTNTTATLRARSAPPSRTSICGYSTGDPSKAWSAPDGYDCRVDTSHGLWGFCPTTVIAAPDCSLGGYCFDDTSCQTGCGRLRNNTRISTWTW